MGHEASVLSLQQLIGMKRFQDHQVKWEAFDVPPQVPGDCTCQVPVLLRFFIIVLKQFSFVPGSMVTSSFRSSKNI